VGDPASDSLAANLRQLVELDRGFGVGFVHRSATPAVSAPPPAAAPTGPRPATAIVAYAKPTRPAPVPSAPTAMPTPPPAPPLATGLPAADLAAVATEVKTCERCGLCAKRTNTVPGEGDPAARLVFVGEGPGADEDAQGRPFVGRAGELLTAMIGAMGFARGEVFICNVVKCRPPDNRLPERDEIAACLPYLHRQLLAIRPTVICTLGNTPLRALMEDEKLGITKLRGQRLDWRGIPLVPTFHPAYLLRNPPAKKPCWEDLKVVLSVMGREAPKKG
jgi:uracil-DNA glycosylase family 4